MAEKKFSQFTDGNESRVGDEVVGLRSGTNYRFDFPGAGIQDSSGNELLYWTSAGAAAANYVLVTSALTGTNPSISSAGSDASPGLTLATQGSGNVVLDPGGTGVVSVQSSARFVSGTGLQTGQSAGNTLLLEAYNTGGASYTAFATLTAGATPTMDLNNTTTYGGALLIPVTGATMTGALILNTNSPSTALQAASKGYVDSVAQGLNIQGSCVCGSTGALTVTYDNGSSGVGATLTNAGAMAAIQLDGVSPTVGQRVLIKNQASALQNGIYTVTTVGSGAVNWVLTRATDFDEPSEIQPGDLVVLTGGTTQTQTSWMQTDTVAAVGVDSITFVQFSASIPVNVASGGTGVTSLTAYAPIFGGTTSTGAVQQTAALTNGQLIIGSTGALPSAATLTAGTGVSITNGAGSITINSTGGGLSTASIAGTSQAAAVNTQYVALNAGQTTVTLPSTFAVGDIVKVVGSTANTGGWIIQAAGGDTVRVLNSTTSAGGTVTSTAQAGECIEVVCDVANTSWVMTASVSTLLTTA